MALRAIKEYWFGGLMAFIVLLCLLFVVMVASAPHNDAKMRGFAPCTFVMAEELSTAASEHKVWQVMTAVGKGYICYAGVMRQGVDLWLDGKQPTPWANYMFKPETFVASAEESEPLSDDLLKANLLDEEENKSFDVNDENKESNNDGK